MPVHPYITFQLAKQRQADLRADATRLRRVRAVRRA